MMRTGTVKPTDLMVVKAMSTAMSTPFAMVMTDLSIVIEFDVFFKAKIPQKRSLYPHIDSSNLRNDKAIMQIQFWSGVRCDEKRTKNGE